MSEYLHPRLMTARLDCLLNVEMLPGAPQRECTKADDGELLQILWQLRDSNKENLDNGFSVSE